MLFLTSHIVGEGRNYIARVPAASIDTVDKIGEALKTQFYGDLTEEDWKDFQV
jgi:hypothetical protein